MVCLVIGTSWTFSYFQFQNLWQAYEEAVRYLELRGVLVSAGSLAEAEEASLVNTEREVESTLSPLSLEEVLDRIKILESSGGKNNAPACEAIGKINYYGYGVNKTQVFCYDNEEANRRAVRDWFLRKEGQGLSLEEMLELYRGGNEEENKKYLANFNQIN